MSEVAPPAEASKRQTKPKRIYDGVIEEKKMLWQQWSIQFGDEPAQKEKKELVDCLVHVLCVHELEDKFSMEVQITKPDGTLRSGLMLDAKTLEDTRRLNAWGTEFGLCNWNMENDQRVAFKTYLMEQPGIARRVQVVPFTGYQPLHGVWICGGYAIDYDGWMRPETHRDTYSVKCRNGATREFRIASDETPRPILRQVPNGLLEGHYSEMGEDAQRLGRDEALCQARKDMNEYCGLIRANFGRHVGSFALGWTVANLFYDDVYYAERSFPHSYFYGKLQSGKDTLANLMWDMAGCSHMGAIPAVKGTSAKGIRDAADLISGVPMWINELRKNDETSLSFMGQIRAMFDGQSGTTSQKERGKLTVYRVRRGMLLGGQDILGSDAEYSRYVLLKMKGKDIVPSAFPAVKAKGGAAHRAYVTLMSTRAKGGKRFLELIDAFKKEIDKATLKHQGKTVPLVTTSRQRFCWAVVLAGLAWATCEPETHNILGALPDGCWEEAVVRMHDAILTTNEDGSLGNFWSVVESAVADGRLQNREDGMWVRFIERPDPEGGGKKLVLAVWLGHVVQFHNRFEKRQASLSMLRAELEEVPSFVEKRATLFYSRNEQGRVWKNSREAYLFDIDVRPHGLPQWLVDYALGRPQEETPEKEVSPQSEAF